MNIFENFKLLKKDMLEKGWVIEAFPFNYKNTEYIVLAKIYQEDDNRPEYALIEVEFLKANNINENLVIPANSNGFIIDARTLREFFDIDYSKNLGDILQQFNKHFSQFIPTQVNPEKPENLKSTMVSSLSNSDSENPNKIYCYSIKRNSKNAKRTQYNDNKSRLLIPNLYLKFKDEPAVSFCYSEDVMKEKSDEEIISNFSKRISV